jgi:hypothetical protein
MKTNEFLQTTIETLLNTIAGGPLRASRMVTTGARQVRLEVRDDSLHTSMVFTTSDGRRFKVSLEEVPAGPTNKSTSA